MSNNKVKKFITTGSGAIDWTIPCPIGVWRIDTLQIGLSAAPTEAQDLTVTIDAGDGALFDALLLTEDLNGDTGFSWTPTGNNLLFGKEPDPDHVGDALDIVFSNLQSRDVGIRVVMSKFGVKV